MTKEHKELLKKLKLDYIKETSPGFFELSGGYKLSIKQYRDDTANGLTACIGDFIKHSGGYVNRISTTGMMRNINGEMKFVKGNTNKGAPDLRFIFSGKSGDIEVKVGRDKMSEAQMKEVDKIIKAGGLFFIAKDFASFYEWWQSVFVSNHSINV